MSGLRNAHMVFLLISEGSQLAYSSLKKAVNFYLFSVVVCWDENISDTVKSPVRDLAEGLLYL